MNANTNEDKVVKAVDMLRAAAPGATIIVFGSYARGETGPDSDVDFLVVEQQLKSRYEEMIRLREVLRPLRIPVDVLVTSAGNFDKWSKVPGTLFYEVSQEGRVFHAKS
jgi:predicted nucleotidyltransferase